MRQRATPSRQRVDSTELSGKGAVTALALSPDGVRVAVVAGEKLYLGVLTPPWPTRRTTPPAGAAGAAPTTDTAADPAAGRTPLEITKLTQLRPDLIHVGPVGFANSRELVVAASTTKGSYRSLWDVSIDGFESRKHHRPGHFRRHRRSRRGGR